MIYFDNAASSMPHPNAVDFTSSLGNPSSYHQAGQVSCNVINQSRKLLGEVFGGEPDNYYFTSGATESANLIIQGYCRFLKQRESHRNEIIVSAIEHPAVYNTVEAMGRLGFKVHVLGVDSCGIIDFQALDSLLNNNTALVCIMGVNNETGVIQPINDIFNLVKGKDNNIVTVCDAVQYLTKVEESLDLSSIDCFFASGHKIGASKGIVFFYLDEHVTLMPLFIGGEQEGGLRPGTENLYGIESLTRALNEYIQFGHKHNLHVRQLKKRLLSQLNSSDINFRLNTQYAPSSDYVLSIAFIDRDAGQLVNFLARKGVCISRGSACSSISNKSSRVLSAMQLERSVINSTIRVSFSYYNSLDEVDKFCEYIEAFHQVLLEQDVSVSM